MNNEQNLNAGTSASMDTKPLVRRSVAGSTPKHKYKRSKRFAYLVISRCEHCGLQRQKVGEKQYLFGEFGKQTSVEPQCLPANDA